MSPNSQPARIVLASASPRRRDLLRLIGIDAEVIPADVDESVFAGELPPLHVERLARAKASVIAARAPDAIVIAADTVVVIDDDILGKPVHRADAERMLRRLAGRTHEVFTGQALAFGGEIVTGYDRVNVTFRKLSTREIRAYVATGEPMDKAGAYGIQGFGATIVERIDGDYFAVMGLSLVRLVALLRKLGVSYLFGPPSLPEEPAPASAERD
jgi:septum formation protein